MTIQKDPCQTSMDILKELCEKWLLEKHQINNPIFIDDNSFLSKGFPQTEIIDIVFFGSFVEKFLRSGNWTGSSFRFWVLSPQVQAVMVKLLGIPKENIGVIPRHEIFPEASPSLKEGARQLVYSGRISPTKNIDLLISTFYHLNRENKNFEKLYLIGEPDNEVLPGQKKVDNYLEYIKTIIQKYELDENVIILPAEKPEQWTENSHFSNPVLITLSSYLHDDFGVSVAQARQKGWPCILSSWGGHLDVSADHSLMIPFSHLYNFHPLFLDGYGQRISLYILNHLTSWKEQEKNSPETQVTLPETMSISKIDELRKSFIALYRPQLIEEYRYYDYLRTVSGEKYKNIFFEEFSHSENWSADENKNVILFENEQQVQECEEVQRTIASLENQDQLELIQFSKLSDKLSLKFLMSAKKIFIVPGQKDIQDQVIKHLSSMGITNYSLLS